MRGRSAVVAMFVLASCGAGSVLAQQQSQRSAADEAVVKGDLDAARKSGDPRKIDETEKTLEQSAADAKSRTGGSGGPVQVGPRFTDLSEQQRRAIYEQLYKERRVLYYL